MGFAWAILVATQCSREKRVKIPGLDSQGFNLLCFTSHIRSYCFYTLRMRALGMQRQGPRIAFSRFVEVNYYEHIERIDREIVQSIGALD